MQHNVYLSLKNIPYFAPLTDNVLLELSGKARPVKFPKNTIILRQGDSSHSLHIILSGKVRVYVSDEEHDFVLQTQGSGSYFGELALITDAPRSASIMALEKTVCAIITQSDFMLWLNQHTEIVAAVLLRAMAEKVQQLTDEIQAMALSDVYQRLTRKLKHLGYDDGDVLVIENINPRKNWRI